MRSRNWFLLAWLSLYSRIKRAAIFSGFESRYASGWNSGEAQKTDLERCEDEFDLRNGKLKYRTCAAKEGSTARKQCFTQEQDNQQSVGIGKVSYRYLQAYRRVTTVAATKEIKFHKTIAILILSKRANPLIPTSAFAIILTCEKIE